MWAFAIWDEKMKTFLSRDRFGEKLYIIYRSQNFYFASEIKLKSLVNKSLDKNDLLIKKICFCL